MSKTPAQGDLKLGTAFGGFSIEGVLGRGAMGVVYRATDVRLHRAVALKVVAAHLAADEGFRDRFVAEARAAAMVEHSGVVTIYAAGEENGTPFIAMKIVDGPELSDVITKAGRLAPQEALKILEPIAGGLDAAATAGIVHRDVKPSNILVPTDGSGAVLVDFGIGRIKGSSRATQSGSWIGTPDYVAPEQIRGEEVDGRADQYSLSCVLYELLTGNPPFVRGEDMQTLWAHVNEEPASIVSIVCGASDELDAVIRKGLAKDPDDRFDSATEMISAARSACGLPVTARAVAVPKVDRRGPTGTVVGGGASAVGGGQRTRTGTVIAGQAPTKKGGKGKLIAVAVVAAVIVIAGIGFAVSRGGGESPSPAASAATATTGGVTTTDTAAIAAAQEDFDKAVNATADWRDAIRAPSNTIVKAYDSCVAGGGDGAAVRQCMKQVPNQNGYSELADWFTPLQADLSNAFMAGSADPTFKQENAACYAAASKAIDLGTRRATLLGNAYKAFLAGNADAATKASGALSPDLPAYASFDGAWSTFRSTCGLPAKKYS